jgi:hypothetical protein
MGDGWNHHLADQLSGWSGITHQAIPECRLRLSARRLRVVFYRSVAWDIESKPGKTSLAETRFAISTYLTYGFTVLIITLLPRAFVPRRATRFYYLRAKRNFAADHPHSVDLHPRRKPVSELLRTAGIVTVRT